MYWCIENPHTGCLRHQPWWKKLDKYMKVQDYCQYKICDHDGEWRAYRFRKATALWSNFDFPLRPRCRHGTHGTGSMVGDYYRGSRDYFRGGKTPPLWYKHAIPTQLATAILESALRVNPTGTWILDCFSGTQSMKRAADTLGLGYCGVDIKPHVYIGNNERVKTHLVKDLSTVDLQQLVSEAASTIGEDPFKLLLLWASPCCTTYSQCQQLCKVENRHRDYSTPERRALTDQARRDDAMTAHWAAALLALEGNTTPPQNSGPCITIQQPLASQAVNGEITTLLTRLSVGPGTWVCVYAMKGADSSLQAGGMIGYVRVKECRSGVWEIDECTSFDILPAACGSTTHLWTTSIDLPSPHSCLPCAHS